MFDCSLREPFCPRLILEKIKKRWAGEEPSARNFASHFGRKAFDDLDKYNFVQAKHADSFQDLPDRPYEDFLVEEIIDSLPSRTYVEEMHVDDPPAPSPEPASLDSLAKQEAKEEEDVPVRPTPRQEGPRLQRAGGRLFYGRGIH